jgi:hypothetical protein
MECRLAGKTEVLGENLPQRYFCPSQKPTWSDPGLTPGRRGGKPATNRLSYGAAFDFCLTTAMRTWRYGYAAAGRESCFWFGRKQPVSASDVDTCNRFSEGCKSIFMRHTVVNQMIQSSLTYLSSKAPLGWDRTVSSGNVEACCVVRKSRRRHCFPSL